VELLLNVAVVDKGFQLGDRSTVPTISKVLSLGMARLVLRGTGEFFAPYRMKVGKPLASLRDSTTSATQRKYHHLGGLFQQGNLITFGSAYSQACGRWQIRLI